MKVLFVRHATAIPSRPRDIYAKRALRRIDPGIEPALASVAPVGHEPMLGALLAQMLGSAQAERLAFKKGGVAPGRLVWFLDPRVLRTLAGQLQDCAPGAGWKRRRAA